MMYVCDGKSIRALTSTSDEQCGGQYLGRRAPSTLQDFTDALQSPICLATHITFVVLHTKNYYGNMVIW